MKIQKIQIKNINGTEELNLEFDPRMNIICGPNGIGKTTVLDSIGHSFIINNPLLKRNQRAVNGSVSLDVIQPEPTVPHSRITYQVNHFDPEHRGFMSGTEHTMAKNFIYLKTNRLSGYMKVDSIRRDEKPDFADMANAARDGIKLPDVKDWLLNRSLFENTANSLHPAQIANLAAAKRCFSVLNKEFTFLRVDAAKFDIVLSTPSGEIPYEYLSSGFRSCLSILFGVIKEIEYRFNDDPVEIKDFDGVIVIDELELHLHPAWQVRIAGILLDVFPKAQFIVTTHSPHIVQSAEPNQIIALREAGTEQDNAISPSPRFGYKGWSVEEVLMDVMGMPDVHSSLYRSKLEEFDRALENEDTAGAERAFSDLNELLHPANTTRKMLRLQLASLKGAPV